MVTRLSVVLVSTQRKWQGGEEQAFQLAQGLCRRGHQVLAVGLRDAPFLRRMRDAGFSVSALTGKQPTPWRCWSLRVVLQRAGANVVHFNDAHALTLGGLAAWRLAGVARFAARRASFAIRGPARYRRLCDRVLCVSHYAANLCSLAGIPDDHLRVVHDGVDPARVMLGDRQRGRAALGFSGNDRLLLAIGSLAPSKGHRYAIEAMPSICQRHPETHLVIAGDGPLRTELIQLAEQRGVLSHVHMLGFRDDIPDLIHASDLFIFPSIEEGLGSTLIDVMLAERPIITTTAGGIPDLILDGQGQLLARIVAPGRADELANAVIDTCAQPAMSKRLVHAAHERALAHFTVDHMVERTLACYYEVLDRRSTSSVGGDGTNRVIGAA